MRQFKWTKSSELAEPLEDTLQEEMQMADAPATPGIQAVEDAEKETDFNAMEDANADEDDMERQLKTAEDREVAEAKQDDVITPAVVKFE